MIDAVHRVTVVLAISVWIVSNATAVSRATAGMNEVRGSIVTSPDCTLGAGTPVRGEDRLLARGIIQCPEGTDPYLRARIELQKRVSGVWVTKAAARSTTLSPSEELRVRVSIPCRAGRYRTFATFRYRWNLGDPWVLFQPPFHSPSRFASCD